MSVHRLIRELSRILRPTDMGFCRTYKDEDLDLSLNISYASDWSSVLIQPSLYFYISFALNVTKIPANSKYLYFILQLINKEKKQYIHVHIRAHILLYLSSISEWYKHTHQPHRCAYTLNRIHKLLLCTHKFIKGKTIEKRKKREKLRQ